MPELPEAKSAQFGSSVSEIFNQELAIDQNAVLKAASIISRDPNYNRRPDYWINVFNITPVEHKRNRPKEIVLRGCQKGQLWVISFRVPNIKNYAWTNACTLQPEFASIRGERFATDLLNPANLSENIWVPIGTGDMDLMHGNGEDLTRRGFFWELRQKSDGYCQSCDDGMKVCPVHDVPSAEALRKTKDKLEIHYDMMVKLGERLANDPKTAIEIGEEHHRAAEYLNINTTWHRRTVIQNACPNCGEPINPGIAYHMSSMGPCILDWQKAVAAGMKKREDVPNELRWWSNDTASEPEKRGPGRPRKVEEQ